MIDVENQVFTKIASALSREFSNISVQSTKTFKPSSFPFVCIEETDSSVSSYHQDSSSSEKYTEVTYEVDVYSNLSSGGKTECKNIMAVIDSIMYSLNMRRLTSIPMDSNGLITHRFARYRAIVGNDESIYRR